MSVDGTGDDLLELLRSLGAPWKRDALCKEYTHLSWVTERGGDTTAQKAVCARCAVTDECLTAGIDGVEVGVWGGTTGRGRKRLRAVAQAALAA